MRLQNLRSSCLCVPPVTKRNRVYVSNDRANSSTVGQAAGFQADSRDVDRPADIMAGGGASSLQTCYSAVMNNFATFVTAVSPTVAIHVSRHPRRTYLKP